MKKTFFLLSLSALLFQSALAQDTIAIKPLKKVLELVIPREGGANAASVAWHPVLKRYYAAMAGNIEFFIGAYSTTGKLLTKLIRKRCSMSADYGTTPIPKHSR